MRHSPRSPAPVSRGTRATELHAAVQTRAIAAALVLFAATTLPCVTNAGVIATEDEVTISSELPGVRRHPAVASRRLYYNDFFVVWDESNPELTGVHVFGTNTSGTASGSTVFQIDAEGSSINEEPDVAAIPDGDGFILVWRRDPNDGGRPYIVGLSSSGEFRVNTERPIGGEYYLGAPEVAVASDKSFIVAWASGEAATGADSGPRSDIFARRFNSNASPVGDDIAVSTPGGTGLEETEFRPDAAATASGGFVIAWTRGQYTTTGSKFYTFVRSFDSLGKPVAPEKRAGLGGVTGPRVDAPRSGGFRVAWSGYQPGDFPGHPGSLLLVKSFDDSGVALDETVRAFDAARLTAAGFAGGKGIAATRGDADELVLAWTDRTASDSGPSSDGDGWGVFAGAYGFGNEIPVNETTAGDQVTPDVAMGAGDDMVAVWETDGSIRGRRLSLIVPECADTDASESTTVSDALFVLQAAVGTRTCEACVCDTDGSGAQTAGDALAVLRESVGIRTTFACPVCPDPFARTFSLTTDASCYGVHLELTSLPDSPSELACKANPALADAGCEAGFDTDYFPTAFEARGCSIRDGQPLFTCHLGELDARSVALNAEVACGCGCADTCPTTPQLCTTIGDQPECSAGQSALAPQPAAATMFTTIAQEQVSVTSSTTCGTCCDTSSSAYISLADEVTLTELRIRFEGTADPECHGEVGCSFVTEAGGPGFVRVEGDTVEMCLSDRDGITGPIALASCEVFVGTFGYGPAEIVRALDGELEPVVPPPVVLVEQ